MPKRGNCTCRYHRIVAACHSRVSIKRYHDASSVNFKTVAKGTRVSMLNNINTNIIHYFSQIPFFSYENVLGYQCVCLWVVCGVGRQFCR